MPKRGVKLGGRELQTIEVGAEEAFATYEVKFTPEKGSDDSARRDRNLHIATIELRTPPVTPGLPEIHKQIVNRMPQPGEERAVARENLGRFAQRAYRRPVTSAEVERLAGFVDLAMREGGSFLEGIQVAVQATLCSPHFLQRFGALTTGLCICDEERGRLIGLKHGLAGFLLSF